MADINTPDAGGGIAAPQGTDTPDRETIEAARARFLAGAKGNTKGKSNATGKGRGRQPRRARTTPDPAKTAPAIAETSKAPGAVATQSRTSDIAARSAGQGRDFVGMMASASADLATERGYRSWAQLDMDEFRNLSETARTGVLTHILTNAQDPRYAAALREADPEFAYTYLGVAPAPADRAGETAPREAPDTAAPLTRPNNSTSSRLDRVSPIRQVRGANVSEEMRQTLQTMSIGLPAKAALRASMLTRFSVRQRNCPRGAEWV
jgi:hypothetical protein